MNTNDTPIAELSHAERAALDREWAEYEREELAAMRMLAWSIILTLSTLLAAVIVYGTMILA